MRDCGKFSFMLIFFLIIAGCTGAGAIKQPYPLLSTPEKTYEFSKLAIEKDDSEAFYYCLSSRTKDRFPISDFRLGWALAGQYFFLFLSSKLKGVETPAPEYGDSRTAKITIVSTSGDLEATFLLINEESNWLLEFPSVYPTPDITKLPQLRRLPWRTYAHTYYREVPGEWFRRFKVEETKKQDADSIRPLSRMW